VLPAPPYWKDGQMPKDRISAEEESVQFNCEVEGVPTPDVKWLVNGVPIEGMFVTFLFFFLYIYTWQLHYSSSKD